MDKLNVINALDALAQESRLDIFRLLVEKGPEGYAVGLIGEKLGLPHATLSFHLDKLRQAGLIENQKQGRATIYTANYDVLVGSIRYLTDNCCKESDMDCRIEIKQKKECC
ncbi:MAG: transcriptional regulator [Kordiimonas sp.]|nr:transcriptional regulator [Kordiimonas sp.]|tara:strand:- start:158 stop:490 length:333 start_codon:yes stop_codon:yes gene_type:complete